MQSTAPSTDVESGAERSLRHRAVMPAGLIAGSITLPAAKIFLRQNWRRIALFSVILFVLGCAILTIYPVRYAATALVVIDPREQRITTEPDVLTGIGQDAAALQSAIEIAKSDGFLLPLINKLNVEKDSDIAGNETDTRRILDRFRSRIDISRRGLTYIVAITFNATTAASAAQYANAIAEAFVSSQKQVRTEATDEAAIWLKSRLKTLSDQLRGSEDAVAAFKRQYGIVNAGRDSTTRQLQVTDLNQQVSAARVRTEEAKARLDQSQRDSKSNVEGPVRSDLLSYLRTQRLQLNDQIAQKTAVFGYRHPDIVIANSQLDALNRQIETERKRNIETARSEYETFKEQQKALEKQFASVENEMLIDGQAAVKLQELQRDADANRNIYEQYLSRFKTTSEQRLLQASQTKVASFANQPTRSTRPPLALLLMGIAVASVITSTAGVAFFSQPGAAAAQLPISESGYSNVTLDNQTLPKATLVPQMSDTEADALGAVIWARIEHPAASKSLETIWHRPVDGERDNFKRNLGALSDAIAARKTGHAKLLLVTSLEPKLGKTLIASSLSRMLLDRRLRALLVKISPDNITHTVDLAKTSITTNATLLLTLLAERDEKSSASNGLFSDFDLIVVDAPAIVDCPQIHSIAAVADYVAIVARSGSDEVLTYQKGMASLGLFGDVMYGLIVNEEQPALVD